MLRFRETPTERELRVQNEWDALTMTRNMTALKFEAQWEAKHRELERVGLGLIPKQKFTQHLLKVGKAYAEAIRMDRRPRSDNAGGESNRTPRHGKKLMK